jgi:hypothetical protein
LPVDFFNTSGRVSFPLLAQAAVLSVFRASEQQGEGQLGIALRPGLVLQSLQRPAFSFCLVFFHIGPQPFRQ